jgi:hypothetical protein
MSPHRYLPKFTTAGRNNVHKPHWPDVGLIIVLALLPCLFFWRLLTSNPADRMVIAAGDFTEQYFPLRAFAAQQWVAGQIPLWNPYLYGGQPALADIQSGALYPLHVLEALLLGWGSPLFGGEIGFPLWALELQVIAHFSLAAVGTYSFGRYLARQGGASRRAARFGGVIASLTFTYGGYFTGFPVQQLTIVEVSAWLPWVMWAVAVAHERLSRALTLPQPARVLPRLAFLFFRSAAPVWAALALALAILAGHPQTVLYICYLSLAYAIFSAVHSRRSESPDQPLTPAGAVWPSLLAHLGLWLMIILLGVALAAAQLLPTLEFIGYSFRADLSYQAVSAGLPLTEFISILYPGFFGGSPAYVGIASLVLITLALSVIPNYRCPKKFFPTNLDRDLEIRGLFPLLFIPQSPNPGGEFSGGVYQAPISPLKAQTFFWTGTGLISLLLAFGSHTFLYPLFYLIAPGFDAVRQQERVFLIYSFSAAVLAGLGALILVRPLSKVSRLRFTWFERRLRWVTVAALGLTSLFIYGSTVSTARGDEVNLFYGVLWHHLFGLIILGGTLVFLNWRARRWLRRTWGMGLLAMWVAFNLFTVNWRFNLEKPPVVEPFTPNGVIQFLQTNLTSNPPLSLGRIASGGLLPGGNSAASVYNLQDLTGNTPLQLALVDRFMQRMPAWRAWQLLNVRYVIGQRNIADAGLALVFEADELKVFQMQDPFPRAWVVSDTEVIPDADQALTRLAADVFDLRRQAVVERPLAQPLSPGSAATVTLTEFSPTSLTVKATTTESNLLVLSQVYYPGWQATVDGQLAELVRVNLILSGVVVPPGDHTVQLRYSPGSFWTGAVVSIIALMMTLGGLIWNCLISSGIFIHPAILR